ncbi:hypothetical protein [Streptomyces sp. XY332]|uniref:hypothetical protein n=1 Tax=Streptomyces sp. XY332 TaxID=1415561 RepID=UPI0006B1840C|nr:hypothetical protein [Streptomyces sp. XY332]KOY55057.1 hypothetical protein ADK59_26880 [Streptomyces sp. XY332]
MLTLAKPDTWRESEVTTETDTTHNGRAEAKVWDRMHPRLGQRGPWRDSAEDELPVLHFMLARPSLSTCRATMSRNLSGCGARRPPSTGADVDRWWQAFLRGFDLEPTFRLIEWCAS